MNILLLASSAAQTDAAALKPYLGAMVWQSINTRILPFQPAADNLGMKVMLHLCSYQFATCELLVAFITTAV